MCDISFSLQGEGCLEQANLETGQALASLCHPFTERCRYFCKLPFETYSKRAQIDSRLSLGIERICVCVLLFCAGIRAAFRGAPKITERLLAQHLESPKGIPVLQAWRDVKAASICAGLTRRSCKLQQTVLGCVVSNRETACRSLLFFPSWMSCFLWPRHRDPHCYQDR